MTLHDLIDDLTTYLNLTPEQQFRVTAKIKRHIHGEKANLCHRLSLYAQGEAIFDRTGEEPQLTGYAEPLDPFIHQVLTEKHEGHRYWESLSDEEIVTWDIGTHRYK